MSDLNERYQERGIFLPSSTGCGAGSWFAVQTKPRHEKKVACELKEKDIAVFLPLYTSVRRWSDRKREVQLPLFLNYVFVRVSTARSERSVILRTNGVRSFVGMGGTGTCISDEEIENVRKVMAKKVPFTNYPFLTSGQKVRIRGGSLDGVRGIFVGVNSDRTLIVSVECLQRSIAVRIDGYGVDPL